MENEIVKKLLESYKLNPDLNTINAVRKLIQIGFNSNWLRNMTIITKFDRMYLDNTPIMEIYEELSLDYKGLSVESIRKVIRDRSTYEI